MEYDIIDMGEEGGKKLFIDVYEHNGVGTTVEWIANFRKMGDAELFINSKRGVVLAVDVGDGTGRIVECRGRG